MVPMMPPFRFVSGEYRIKHVSEAWEQAACAALRRDVFCAEQRVFEHDDADGIDQHAFAIAAVACVAGIPEQVVGTVRIHQPNAVNEPGLWQGSRLAVHADYRGAAWLGSQLIIHAVSTAHARGCTRFLAQVQVQNVALFERLHWQSLRAIEVQNRPHVLMQADLDQYPPRVEDEIRFFTPLRRAA